MTGAARLKLQQTPAEGVPHYRTSSAYPFTGFFLNLNVRTLGHSDDKDHSICLVLYTGRVIV